MGIMKMNKKLLNLKVDEDNNTDIIEKINFILKENRVPRIWRVKIEGLIKNYGQNDFDEGYDCAMMESQR